MTPHERMTRLLRSALVILSVFGCSQPDVLAKKTPSQMAQGAFRGEGGFSFRVELADNEIRFKRTVPDMPRGGEALPAWAGESYLLFRASPGSDTRKLKVNKTAWDHQVGTYAVSGGQAKVVVSRLTPAVLIDSPAKEVAFQRRGPAYLAFLSNGKVVAGSVQDVAGSLAIDEPWVLGWFGRSSPYRNFLDVADLDDEHLGADKVSLSRRRPVRLDMPLLFRLEHRHSAIRSSGSGITFEFPHEAGKIAVMPLFGGKGFQPKETEGWAQELPRMVLERCRLWSEALRDYPLSVEETYSADMNRDVLSIQQTFAWESFHDDWNTPPVKAAPIPPMLALALGGNVPVTFHHATAELTPLDYNLMDTPGKAMGIKGADGYEYRIHGLGQYLFYQRKTARPSEETEVFRARLEAHVQEMVDSGHLAPLFYVYGGIGGEAPAYFYWSSSPDLAKAILAAYPYLSEKLRRQVGEYLKNEWRINPPFDVRTERYFEGANRAPYEVPWQEMRTAPAFNREKALRQSRLFGDLYGVQAYTRITGDKENKAPLEGRMRRLADELLATQDWALCGPVKPHTPRRGFYDPYSYYRRNGQSTYNTWLAGAIGLVRLARDLGWKEEEALGWYLFGKLAMARIGQARYTAELHRMGLVRGGARDDWRTLVHIDRETAIVLRGSVFSVVREDQEIPPFIDLVEEVGRMLGRHAREECRFYLDNLDESMPLWWISEAPKQSASEQRLCPLQHRSGNVLAQYWVLGKTREEFRWYVDTTRFKGDFYYMENLAALIDTYAAEAQ